MAKGETKHHSTQRAPRSKTPAQRQKAADNIKAADERLKQLQARQRLAKELRALHGYTGGDNEVLAKYEKDVLEASATKYVDFVLNKCSRISKLIRRWLADRIYLPVLDQERLIREFLGRPQNAVMSHNVKEWMALAEKQAA